MNANKQERAASIVLTVFSLAYLVFAFLIPMPVLKQQLGPDGFPKAIGFGMLALSLIYLHQQFRGGVKKEDKGAAERATIIGAEEKIESKADLKSMGFILVAMLFYASAFERLGYAISTFLVFMAGVLYLDRRHLVRDLVIAVMGSFVLWYAFGVFLRVKLPAGPLDFLGW